MAQKITSITLSAVDNFLKTSKPKQRLQCEMIQGFHLYKNIKGACFRYRYKNIEGKIKNKVIGQASEIKPYSAAEKALEIKLGNVDPFALEEQRRKEHFEEQINAQNRSLGGYFSNHYTEYQSRKRSGNETLRIIKQNFSHLFARDMTTISKTDIKEWQRIRETKYKNSFATIQRAYGALKTMLNKAVSDCFIKKNPLPTNSLLERPHFKEVDIKIDSIKTRRLLHESEVQKIQEGIKLYNQDLKRQRSHSIQRGRKYLPSLADTLYASWSIPFTYLAYTTGMRPGDIKSLKWQNFDNNFTKLTFIPNKTRHHPDPIKVTLHLPKKMTAIIRNWHAQHNHPNSGLLFYSSHQDKELDKKAHIRHWKHIVKFGGLQKDLDFYSLRHHWISTLLQTQNLLQVAKMAGHKSTLMIEKHYGHLIPERSKEALQVFDI